MVIRPMIVDGPAMATPNVWAMVTVCVAMLAVFLLSAWLICRKFSKGTDMFRHWPLYLSAVVGLILLLTYGATITTVKGMILTLVLLYASLMDLKSRQCPNFIPAMILILAFVGFKIEDLASMLAGAAAVFIPQLATNMLAPNRAIGGADIKISTALAFLMGAEKGIFALLIGLLLAVIVTAIRNGLEKRDQKASFALVPYLWIGATIAYLI